MEEQQAQPISKNLWWVIPGKLAGVRKPTVEELSELQSAGVGAIVSVFHNSDNLNLYQQAEVPHLWLPIEIDSVPNPVQIQDFRDFVESQKSLGSRSCSALQHWKTSDRDNVSCIPDRSRFVLRECDENRPGCKL